MSFTLPPGVVYGSAYQDLIAHAKSQGYALAAVNVVGTHSLNAVLEAAAKHKSDIIIQLSNGGARFFAGLGYPDPDEAMVLGAVSAAHHVHILAKKYGICIILHTDHANRALLPWIEGLITANEMHYRHHQMPLFSSHMLDLSEEPLEDNLSECARILEQLARLEISLEIELGVTGGEEDGIGSELHEDDADNPRLYTQPHEVLKAYEKLSPLGHFSIAASFGNVHGVYKPGRVKLRPLILQASQRLVAQTHHLQDNPLDLVFHGGSGSESAKIREAISYGVFKMNIDTDTQFAFAKGVGQYIGQHEKAFAHQIDPNDGTPLKKHYDPRKWLRQGEIGIGERLIQAFKELGSLGKSVARKP